MQSYINAYTDIYIDTIIFSCCLKSIYTAAYTGSCFYHDKGSMHVNWKPSALKVFIRFVIRYSLSVTRIAPLQSRWLDIAWSDDVSRVNELVNIGLYGEWIYNFTGGPCLSMQPPSWFSVSSAAHWLSDIAWGCWHSIVDIYSIEIGRWLYTEDIGKDIGTKHVYLSIVWSMHAWDKARSRILVWQPPSSFPMSVDITAFSNFVNAELLQSSVHKHQQSLVQVLFDVLGLGYLYYLHCRCIPVLWEAIYNCGLRRYTV